MTTIVGIDRCGRCGKRMATDGGEDESGRPILSHRCDNCGHSTDARLVQPPWSVDEIRRAIARQNAKYAPQGVEVPMVYTAAPFPEPDWSEDEPSLFPITPLVKPTVPAHHERVGTYLLTGWCQRCQRPGKSYTACRCTLPPDRYVRFGDSHA